MVVAVGVIQAIRGGFEFAHGGSGIQILIGLGLVALGVVVFFINRWQAKRNL